MGTKALEILTDDPNRVKPVLTEVFPISCGVVFGFASMVFLNAATRRPVFSGIQKHISAAAIGGVLAHYVEGQRQDYIAERDAVLRYYVETHRDEFPDPERKKFSEVIHQWFPIR